MTVTKILSNVVSALKTKFSLKVYTLDTEEGYEPNCFYVEIISDNITETAQAYTKEAVTLCITYFSTTKKAFESELAIKTGLEEIFGRTLSFKDSGDDYSFLIMNKEYTFTSNHTLQLTFSIEIVNYAQFNIDTTNNNTMQNLIQNEEVN